MSRDLVRQTRLDELYNGTDTNCISQLRMRKDVFWKLSSHLRDAGLLRDTIHVTVEEQLAMFLHTVGHNLRNCVIGFYFKKLCDWIFFKDLTICMGQEYLECWVYKYLYGDDPAGNH